MSFEPTPDELQVLTVVQTRLLEQFADTISRGHAQIATEAAARGIQGGYVISGQNKITGEAMEKYAADLMWALVERLTSIYGALTVEMIDWIDAKLEEATVLLQKDEATHRAYSRAKQVRMIELGTLRAKLRRITGTMPSPADATAADATHDHDAFICHASEDKTVVATPLANKLSASYKVWYDDFALTIGDSLRQKIDRGLVTSRYGIVILSPRFFEKHWPAAELSALFSRQNAEGKKVILPVWVDLTHVDVSRQSPLLADLVAAHWSDGIDKVVHQISQVLDIK